MGLFVHAPYYLIRGYNTRVFNRLKSWLSRGWRRRWRRAHLAFSPVGVLIATGLLSRYAGVWGWNDRERLGFLADLVPLGVVVYAAAVFAMEWVVRMVFWALAQREKDIEKRRAEGRAVGVQEGRAVGVQEGRAVGVQEGRAQGLTEGLREGRREARDQISRVLHGLERLGIEIPPDIISSELVGQEAALLENGDVYAGLSQDVYIGRIDQAGQEFLALQGQPPEDPGLWYQRGWRVQLDRHYDEFIPFGRIQGLNLNASPDGWTVSLS